MSPVGKNPVGKSQQHQTPREIMRLFVYGTLKRGQVNHRHYFGAQTAVESARVRGRLVHLRQGYPMLVVPAEEVLAIGTPDFRADAERQAELNQGGRNVMAWMETEAAVRRNAIHRRTDPSAAPDGWPLVQGEIIEMSDFSQRLSLIDALEDYDPVSQTGLYVRALVWAEAPRIAVWTYIAPDGRSPPDALEWGPKWP